MHPLLAIILLSGFGSLLGLIGGVTFLVNKKISKTLARVAIPFAAGVLITTSLYHLIPEAIEEAGQIGSLVVLIAFLISFFFEEFFANMHHHEGHAHITKSHGSVPLVLFGDTIHNAIDGVAIAAAYLVDPQLGVVVAIATFLHEIPHEIGDFGVLVASGWSRKNAMLANVFSAVTTIFAAVLTYVFAEPVESVLGILLAVSAGIFLYLGASDFLPDLVGDKRAGRTQKFVSLLLGVLVILLVSILAPEH